MTWPDTDASSAGYQPGMVDMAGMLGNPDVGSGCGGSGTYTTSSTCFSASLTLSLPDMSCGSSMSRSAATDRFSWARESIWPCNGRTAHDSGRDAVRLAEVGLDRMAQTGGVARVAARLHAMRAKAMALRGDRAGCLDALTRAERALDGRNDHEHAAWSVYFDEGSLVAETASALHLLGDLREAEQQAGAATAP